jgi:hypothetical protein
MANIPIWPGSSSFAQVYDNYYIAGNWPPPTPFGFYDNDPIFQSEGPKVAKFIASRLGYPLVDVELQSGSIYTCFEEAITVYGKELYLWKIKPWDTHTTITDTFHTRLNKTK